VSKNAQFLSVPLNANELLLPALEILKTFMYKPESDNDGETQAEVTTCRKYF